MSDVTGPKGINISEIDDSDPSAMSEAKLWLFKENMRLMNLAAELEEKEAAFKKESDSLRAEMKTEMNKLKVRESQLIMQKKHVDDQLNILRRGFDELNADRATFEAKKRSTTVVYEVAPGSVFFKGINTEKALKKRYKDLLKIFHPDNNGGDNDTVIMIKKEYENILDEL